MEQERMRPPKTKTGSKPEERRGGPPRQVSVLVPKITKRALGKRGFAEAGLITEWAAIVGPDLARQCTPERIAYPPGKRSDGALHIRAATGVALELQHLEPQVLERINGYLGYRAVIRLRVSQGPVRRGRSLRAERQKPEPRFAAPRFDGLDGVEDEELRCALARLGGSVSARKG